MKKGTGRKGAFKEGISNADQSHSAVFEKYGYTILTKPFNVSVYLACVSLVKRSSPVWSKGGGVTGI